MSVLQVNQVSHSYRSRSFVPWRQQATPVLSNVSLTVEAGQCFGLLGMSGAGKSTLGRILLGLERPSEGHVLFEGQDIYTADKETWRAFRRHVQVVFQDAYSSVNPRMTAEDIIAEPLDHFLSLTKEERRRTVIDLLERVGLSEADRLKRPNQFSGGQLQRINIARAIATKPNLIVLDESVSSLDLVNKQLILDLLLELKREDGLSYVFITHDIKAAYTISDHIGVLNDGELIATYETPADFFTSTHPFTEQMRASMLAEHPRDRTIRNR